MLMHCLVVFLIPAPTTVKCPQMSRVAGTCLSLIWFCQVIFWNRCPYPDMRRILLSFLRTMHLLLRTHSQAWGLFRKCHKSSNISVTLVLCLGEGDVAPLLLWLVAEVIHSFNNYQWRTRSYVRLWIDRNVGCPPGALSLGVETQTFTNIYNTR